MPRFSVVLKFLLPALAISAIIWVGSAQKAKAQSASSGTSNPLMDMSATDVIAFLLEQGLQSLSIKSLMIWMAPRFWSLSNGMTRCLLERVQRVVTKTSIGINFRGLCRRYPRSFQKHSGNGTPTMCAFRKCGECKNTDRTFPLK
jgi:hypothetical protein